VNRLDEALALLDRGDWKAAHTIVQEDEGAPYSAWAHGIVHIVEGDLDNARYWYDRAKRDLPANPSAAEELRAIRDALRA
jgi:hypothetical protein